MHGETVKFARKVIHLNICSIVTHVYIILPAGKLLVMLPIVIKIETDINCALKVHAV